MMLGSKALLLTPFTVTQKPLYSTLENFTQFTIFK